MADNSTRVNMLTQHTVDLRRLKSYAAEALPLRSPLREVLMAMEDQVSASEFVAHIKVWLVLLRREGGSA